MSGRRPGASGSLGLVVPLEVAHLDDLYALEAGPDRFLDWRFKGVPPAPNAFATVVLGCWLPCAVLDNQGRLRGAVTLARHRADEATAELAVVGAPGSANVLVMAAAIGIVAGALDRGLAAVYLHTTAYQAPVPTMLLRRFRPEVHRVESDWHRGRYWDSYVFRIDRTARRDRLARVERRAEAMAAVHPSCWRPLGGSPEDSGLDGSEPVRRVGSVPAW